MYDVVAVEGDRAVRELLSRVFAKLDWKFSVFEHSYKALAYVACEGADILIADLTIPKMRGIDLVNEVREKHHDLPVLVLTAGGEEKHLNPACISRVLKKPFLLSELVREILDCCEFAECAEV
ncbi:MAG: response regulator [Planctomycetota bacterium]